jgi:medium-chain acyl-[acyl-carrier-protein] hydrolase
MNETYLYAGRAGLDCPISAFGGHDDFSSTLDELKGWREQTSATFKLRMFPGTHFFINTARNELLQAIAEDLEGSLGGLSSKLLFVNLG